MLSAAGSAAEPSLQLVFVVWGVASRFLLLPRQHTMGHVSLTSLCVAGYGAGAVFGGALQRTCTCPLVACHIVEPLRTAGSEATTACTPCSMPSCLGVVAVLSRCLRFWEMKSGTSHVMHSMQDD